MPSFISVPLDTAADDKLVLKPDDFEIVGGVGVIKLAGVECVAVDGFETGSTKMFCKEV